ncbi:hypothetical protein [Pontibacter kalidii]|uniref:hypothetical protein n=1 Tax=Pontibacter kalidii TaxID=2592049 RepID=UPI002256CD2C|nr:hypothetical protein [Pontibacter kalidii]
MNTKPIVNDFLNTKEKKLAFFQNLVLIAVADKYVDDAESDFLLTIGEQLGLTQDDTLPIADNLSTLAFIVPEQGLHKHLELQTLIMMVLQDGKVEEREYKLCLEYTRGIGYTQEILDNLIRWLTVG